MSDMKICIQNLGKYNEGELHFKWIDLPVDDDELQEAMDEIGINDEYEEFMIADFECSFMDIGEWDSIAKLNEIAEKLDELDEWEENKLMALLEHGEDFDSAIDMLDDCSLMEDVHTHEQLGDYVLEQGLMGEIPEKISWYIDTERLGRDIYLESRGGFTSYGYLEIYN